VIPRLSPESCIKLPMRPQHAVWKLLNDSLEAHSLSRIPSRRILITHWPCVSGTPGNTAPLAR
jgi:hypothetical protein